MKPKVGYYAKYMLCGSVDFLENGSFVDNMEYEYGKIIGVEKYKSNDIDMFRYIVELFNPDGSKYTRISTPDDFECISEDDMMIELL